MIPRPAHRNPLCIPLSAGARAVRLRGSEGVAALRRTVDVSVPTTAGFRMDLAIAATERVRVLHVVSTPFAIRWPGSSAVDGSSVFVLPMEGSLAVDASADLLEVDEGGLALSTEDPVVVRSSRPVRLLVLCADNGVSERRRADPVRVVPATSTTATARTMLRAFLAELDPENAVQAEYLEGTVLRLARLLGSEREEGTRERLGLHDMVEAALQVIQADFSDPTLDPSTVARRCRVSLRTLQRAVADERGSTLRKLISDVRTENALRLVGTPDSAALPLSDIARRSGFSSPERLRRAIATETGLSPSEYRRRLNGEDLAAG
ncbi:helix-turn-helix domain-containing protein [Rathayibacter sp. VKM Ac-2804]|uniref:AraC family transcriptional regulator n=1 Tax=unclassified Rathayibacter TaxID=2609250 RepID=UPI00132EBD4C|nr:AraC family transcriptional regulator [Rathayibacter sp. VKM Ac-2804]NRG41248.1 AraC family transcriptional regulator [Rathayibacter sp. VKM Ac-2835]QHF25554.1 helix-turn-helix domain-containing protein [Rathayibacter sp. VKM Ac-2804]